MISFSDQTARDAAHSMPLSAWAFAWAVIAALTFAEVVRSDDGLSPLPVDTNTVLGAQPEAEQTPAPPAAPCDEDKRAERGKFTPCICAAKMTIRRDPTENMDVYECLKPRDPFCLEECKTVRTRPDVIGWMNPTPYGQYIFIHHDPLLFEDIPAERYGEAFKPGVQPVVSLVKFVGAVPILPYKISMNHSAAKDYGAYYAYDHHGNLRPGVVEGAYLPDYYLGAPYPKARFKASLIEIGVATGVVLFLP